MKLIRSFLLALTLVQLIAAPLSAMKPVPVELLSQHNQQTLSPELQNLTRALSHPSKLCNDIVNLDKFYGQFFTSRMVKTVLIQTKRSLDQTRDSYDLTPLHCAAISGNTNTVITLLIVAELEVETLLFATDCNGTTALSWAAHQGNTDVVKTLITFTYNQLAHNTAWKLICMPSIWNATALHNAVHYAMSSKKTASLRAFLELIANTFDNNKTWDLICIPNKDGKTAYTLGNDEVKLIVGQYDPAKNHAQQNDCVIQ